MPALPLRRLKSVYRLANEVIQVGHCAESWVSRLGAGLAEVFDARMVGLAWAHIPTHPEEFNRSEVEIHYGFNEAENQLWCETYAEPDGVFRSEVLRRIVQYPARFATLRRQDVISDEEWYALQTTQEVHRALNIDQFLTSHFLVLSMRRIFGIALHRAWGRPAYSVEDRRLLRTLHLELAHAWRDRISAPEDEDPAIRRLSPRLRQVLWLLCLGRSEKAIAGELSLSVNTVHNHVTRLYRELSVQSRAELLARSLSQNIEARLDLPSRAMNQFRQL